jgi:hypothetical protein
MEPRRLLWKPRSPSVGRDGAGYRSDLGKNGTGIFLQRGLDRPTSEQPVGQISRPVRCSSMSEGALPASSRYYGSNATRLALAGGPYQDGRHAHNQRFETGPYSRGAC